MNNEEALKIRMKNSDFRDGYEQGKADAIDEYMNKLCDICIESVNDYTHLECPFHEQYGCKVISIAEQLKEKNNGEIQMC